MRFEEEAYYMKEVFDRQGNFVGYTEKVSKTEYNHFDRDGNFLASTESEKFDFKVALRGDDDS